MTSPLYLDLTDYVNPNRWRWVLYDEQHAFVADHQVALDPTSTEANGFANLDAYLHHYQPSRPVTASLAHLGAWMGEAIFGGLRAALRARRRAPVTPVYVSVPAAANVLLLRPFELAHLDEHGATLAAAGIRLIYQLPGAQPPPAPARQSTLRLLSIFSLPDATNPLNLRQERYALQQLVARVRQTKGISVELRILQYGATRATLRAVLQEAPGWDLIQISGHGLQGKLLLEDAAGHMDALDSDELADLLDPTRARLKLLLLNACYTGAASHEAARRAVGLESPDRHLTLAAATPPLATDPEPAQTTVLPSLAQALAQRLDCAALAMRYPVADNFAIDLMVSLYDKLLDKGQPLAAALQLALGERLDATSADRYPPLSPLTPILFGPGAAALTLPLPPRGFTAVLPTVGLYGFPSEPERFVGRLGPMVRASRALAPQSDARGVIFHGMPGAGKTACALELAYRHERARFVAHVWWQAPLAGDEIAGSLTRCLLAVESQLGAPELGLTLYVDQPERFRRQTLPQLRALLEQHAILLVLDNLESLLTAQDGWRDPLWGDFIAALLAQRGLSRTVLTARRIPTDLLSHGHLHREAIHSLSFAESVLLARDLDNLQPLFGDEEGRRLLQGTLRLVQGHPKLLELANGLAANRSHLAQQVAAATPADPGAATTLDAFFAPAEDALRAGESRQGERAFVATLHQWTQASAADLPPAARLLLIFLARLEAVDRVLGIVEANWEGWLQRVGDSPPPNLPPSGGGTDSPPPRPMAVAFQARPPSGGGTDLSSTTSRLPPFPGEGWGGVPPALAHLTARGLIQATAAADLSETTLTMHPCVAEAVLAQADAVLGDAVDIALGDFWYAMAYQARQNESQGQGGRVRESARRAAPYLLRQARWQDASILLEQLLQRDQSPSTVAFVLPLLRHIAAATAGSARGPLEAGQLARALHYAGRTAEAAATMRQAIAACIAAGLYRAASAYAGDLLNLLRDGGQLEAALAVATEKVGYTQQAGLGPWTQLGDETRRLQILNAMGQYEQVLAAVEALRPTLATLPLTSEAEESANPWNTREVLLDTGRSAAMRSAQWETALTLNGERLKSQQERGADAFEQARVRFNDNFPLLRLGRYGEAANLLHACRQVFEKVQDVAALGKVYSALADLEDEQGHHAEAVRFEEVALGYKYQAGLPADCAVSHNNLALYLARTQAPAAQVLAHRLAATTIGYQTGSGEQRRWLNNLSSNDLPATPPTFAQVVATVEAVAGVRFAALFAGLPLRAADGDAALAAVWALVAKTGD